jgi:hypothetical protein
MGLPVLSDMDGKVIEKAICHEKLYVRKVKDLNEVNHKKSIKKEEEELIYKHLKGLGYI